MDSSTFITPVIVFVLFVYSAVLDSFDHSRPVCDDYDEFVIIPDSEQWIDVTATIYHAVPEQTDDTPFVTACGHRIDTALVRSGSERTLAVSRDLLERFPFGTEVMVYVDGKDEYCCPYVVRDLMNARYTNAIDILVDESVRYGKYRATIKAL